MVGTQESRFLQGPSFLHGDSAGEHGAGGADKIPEGHHTCAAVDSKSSRFIRAHRAAESGIRRNSLRAHETMLRKSGCRGVAASVTPECVGLYPPLTVSVSAACSFEAATQRRNAVVGSSFSAANFSMALQREPPCPFPPTDDERMDSGRCFASGDSASRRVSALLMQFSLLPDAHIDTTHYDK